MDLTRRLFLDGVARAGGASLVYHLPDGRFAFVKHVPISSATSPSS